MSAATRPTDLREALTHAGFGRELGLPGGADLLDRWDRGLAAFTQHYERRFRETVDPFAWWARNRIKAQAFFQPDTLSLSAEMKAAVWRVLLGSDIKSVELRFSPEDGESNLRLVLRSPYGDVEEYQSNYPDDVKLLRHLGTVSVDGRLEFQGYHAFRR